MSTARAQAAPGRKGKRPYSKGWRAAWRGDWGGFGDGHCRLAKLAKQLESELLEDYYVRTVGERRALWRAARFQALAEMQLARVGSTDKVVVSRSTKPAAVAEKILSRLTKRSDAPPLDVAQQYAQAHRETTNGA